MALSGLDIYKLLPKTNCRDCGFSTCLAFAMALAQKKASLDKCPHVTDSAREALESASQPPIKLVTIGKGESRIEIGNETVMYRHEQKFYHPTAIGILVEDTLIEAEIAKTISEINGLHFERVGQTIGVNLVCIKNSSKTADKFLAAVCRVASATKLNLALSSSDGASVSAGLAIIKDRRPLVICEDQDAIDDFINTALEYNVPLAVTSSTLDEASELTAKAKKLGLEELVINIKAKGIASRIQDFTFARRAALRKNIRTVGYPVMAFTDSGESPQELAEAVSYVLKYAGLVIVKNTKKEFIFPLLVARQDVYQDPQKPVQVEPKIYEIGKVTKDSPLLVTTNFSITYFTVAGEVESSKVPSRILCCDAEGMSVLTAWAAEKFTAETIADTLDKSGIKDMISHKRVIIPGYVSVLSGKLEEVSGWQVAVGPREASGIPNYLRGLR
ncbi:MAG: acetyl-CoA decarbonylase/synthase complex subunit gamma [Candidatus Omnitrophica bacterium]|nr:acetyl-CoA decarbonylase/synthase complex subunit gamma [Candidatus Omnitrophota bacterium]